MNTKLHTCGGTILGGFGGQNEPYRYCDRCQAFAYASVYADPDSDAIPSGTDKAANQAAWDNGDDESPEAV